MGSPLLRKNLVTAAAVAAGALTAVSFIPAHAAEYSSALKIRGVQYDAPGRDSNSCSSGNTDQEYLTVKNYSSRSTINLKATSSRTPPVTASPSPPTTTCSPVTM
jgi:hypothetical protein